MTIRSSLVILITVMETLSTIKIYQWIKNFERSEIFFLGGKGLEIQREGWISLTQFFLPDISVPFSFPFSGWEYSASICCELWALSKNRSSVSRPVYFFLMYIRFSWKEELENEWRNNKRYFPFQFRSWNTLSWYRLTDQKKKKPLRIVLIVSSHRKIWLIFLTSSKLMAQRILRRYRMLSCWN